MRVAIGVGGGVVCEKKSCKQYKILFVFLFHNVIQIQTVFLQNSYLYKLTIEKTTLLAKIGCSKTLQGFSSYSIIKCFYTTINNCLYL